MKRKIIATADIETYDGPPGVKLMQSHSPAVLGGVYVVPHNTGKSLVGDVVRGAFHDAKVKPGMSIQGSIMGPDEYALRKLPKLREKK